MDIHVTDVLKKLNDEITKYEVSLEFIFDKLDLLLSNPNNPKAIARIENILSASMFYDHKGVVKCNEDGTFFHTYDNTSKENILEAITRIKKVAKKTDVTRIFEVFKEVSHQDSRFIFNRSRAFLVPNNAIYQISTEICGTKIQYGESNQPGREAFTYGNHTVEEDNSPYFIYEIDAHIHSITNQCMLMPTTVAPDDKEE
ncbi:hypothetical protein [Vibrio barjaei]|uniref:hypothetical protein n=1 Tax=Vibrio barjaei TaxID=1676683 RepID=UPI002284493A|nr:hypothetical protein [Vibrio barjaei]MCY9874608.1 hypothetical protein [Vibrio barjaei]